MTERIQLSDTTTMRIEVYPSSLPGAPLETHEVEATSLSAWLESECPGYDRYADAQPIVAVINGNEAHPKHWENKLDPSSEIKLFPKPRIETAVLVQALISAAASFAISFVLSKITAKNSKTSSYSSESGKSLAGSSLDANKPKLNGIIPEIAGRRKIYPDYLVPPRTVFSAPGKQCLRTLLCIGVGHYAVDAANVRIGESSISEFGTAAAWRLYGPGEDLSGEECAQNWYTAPEVGSSSGSAGLHLPGSLSDAEPGSESKLRGEGTAALNFGAMSASFRLTWVGDYVDVSLSVTFSNFSDLVTELNSQIKTKFQLLNVSHNSGVISIIEAQSPQNGYSGSPIRVAGTSGDVITRLFGGSIIYTDGTPTTGRWIGPFKATPGNESARGFEIDLYAQNGLGVVDQETGSVRLLSRQIEVQWWAGDGASGSQILTFSGSTRDQIGATYGIDIGAPRSHVYYKARRLALESTDSLYYDKIDWYGLKARLESPVSYPGVTTIAVALDGSNEISSASDSKINLIVTRMFNIGEPTRNIADWVRYVCTDAGYSLNDIENSELDALQQNWSARGDYYDYVVDSQTTVKEELARVLRCGFAELTLDHGKIRPVRDHLRTQYEQMYTPQNMTSVVQKSFSAYDQDDHDGVDVRYIDPNTWEEETVQCRLPGDVGARAETIEAEGICDRTRAWRLGMRQRRSGRYRRRTLKFSTELDALNSRYLSYCLVCDDVPGYAQSAIIIGYSENGSTATLTVSEPLPWVNGVSHVCALRRPDGTVSGPYAATRIDDHRLSIPVPDFDPIVSGSYEPTHVLFGKTTRQGYPVLITEIAPNGSTQVYVTAVGYDPRVYEDDNNSPA